ncbi:MAG: NADH-quinone oxidoreductase subunit D [Candidatus Omnitrophica bacterium]|nr:NADH-quinone oxidoreductase subunit D [Candidatus Omnitrophota bacterium]MDD5671421.1 NADH-quinone oxidoreductase subunit D [Candidatus Omnitrophota bacterium]
MPKSYTVQNTDLLDTQTLEVNFGPQHPSTHGVFRMFVELDGEVIVTLKPVMGYLHRNHEQIAENLTYLGIMPYTDRLDYFNAMTNNLGYAMAVEKLAGITVPERAQYIRVIVSEFTRLINHLSLVGFLLNDLGAFFTPILYAFREREKILDVFEEISGSRMMCNYLRFGGVKCDLSPAVLETMKKITRNFPKFLDEFEALLSKNEILCMRCQNVGVLPKELAVNSSITGPVLRASGINYDIRKVDRYSLYDRFRFRVPLGRKGDTYDRYYVRVLEMRESVKILEQALQDIPVGEILNPKTAPFAKAPRNFKPPVGEDYGRIESPKGELGYYVVSDGTPQPWRYHIRAPSFINLTILEDICLGHKVADAIIILGSLDIVLGEVDR